MDRPKRAATKVTDFRKYHLSGDLDQTLQGRVDSRITQFKMAKCPEDLQQELEEEKAQSKRLMEEVEMMRMQHELEAEKLKQKEWHLALEQLKENRENAEREHAKYLEDLKEAAGSARDNTSRGMLDWFRAQSDKINPPGLNLSRVETEEEQRIRLEKEAKEKQLRELQNQQEQISQKIAELTGTKEQDPESGSQGLLLQQLKTTLSAKKEDDPNKMLLKALITAQNKVAGEGGTSTLKPALLNNLTGTDTNSMADWLANLNRQEEDESEVSRLILGGEGDTGHKSTKNCSGILDKATTNIQQKQVWPQQNLGEDWADEEVEFKQIRFEHLVAGETRTIEMCTDPAQILGRLRLLWRIAYLKLRGYEWPLIRKMYAAFLTSIETKEYSWESNFDRFETILYRRVWGDARTHTDTKHSDREPTGRRRYCREYNRVEGCPKNSPHPVWFGNGPSAVKRTVYHLCAACLIRDKQHKEHPEGHPDCPHKA